MLSLALPKGKLLPPSIAFLGRLGISHPNLSKESRRLIFEFPDQEMRIVLVRATDVPTYVEHGATDLGIVGDDLLMEQMRDLYEPLDLEYGRCKVVLAEMNRKGTRFSHFSKLRVATKYPNITDNFFSKKGVPIEIVKLYGSLELAPEMGLADQIVDISDTGETLRLHSLNVVEEIMSCSARLIVNRASWKLKYVVIQKWIQAIQRVLKEKE